LQRIMGSHYAVQRRRRKITLTHGLVTIVTIEKWVTKVYQDENQPITWPILEKELLARFGPTEYEDYDEALSWVKQKGTLREYHKELEKLVNRVVGWPQKALIGTFLGRLKVDISNDVHKFKPRTFRETIEFARMREDEVTH
jgi:hypothetical protein